VLCKGVGGSLEVLEDRVVLKHTMVLGITTGFFKGHKTIPYSAISAVQYKRSGVLSGYIQFTLAGGVEPRRGIWEAQSDENTITFTNNEVFDKAREFIEARIGYRSSPPAPVAPSPNGGSIVETLERLLSLREKGALTAEEYEEQKATVLGKSSITIPIPAARTNDKEIEETPSEDKVRMMAAMERALQVAQPSAQPAPTFGRRTAAK
jgi:hypothetical protein